MTQILLVEEDSDIIKLLSLHLNTSGYGTASCAAGHGAIKKAAVSPFNLIILDEQPQS